MEVLDLRLLGADDLRPLLEEEREAWRETLRWDFAPTAAMVLRFLQARALTGYALRENGRIVGYSFYVIENSKGLIGDAFLTTAFCDGSSEVRLLTHVLETLQAMPGVGRVEAQLLHLNGPELRQLFLSEGFQEYDRQFLYLPLAEGRFLPAPADSGVRFASWEPKWFPAAAALIQAAYRGHVDSIISDQYRSQAGAVRFLENIIRLPGCGVFLPEASFLAFSPGEELCGMVLTSVVSDRVAHVTQLCVAPRWQRRGLGRCLLGMVAGRLRENGFEGATLSVTDANTYAVALYRRLGFRRLTAFPAFVWDARREAQRIIPAKAASPPQEGSP